MEGVWLQTWPQNSTEITIVSRSAERRPCLGMSARKALFIPGLRRDANAFPNN
jgi:hypothetical protein